MTLLQVLCVVLCASVGLIHAKCPFKAEIIKLEPCDKKQPDVFDLPKPYSLVMVHDNCDVAVSGCVAIHQDVKSAKFRWTVWHNKNKIHTGEKEVCGYKFGNMDTKCPLNKGRTMCVKSEVVKNPVGPIGLGMFEGDLKLKYEAVTDAGVTQCMIGLGRLSKDKK